MPDLDNHKARALVIEGNPLLRSVVVNQLRELGYGQVAQVARPKDGRLLIERGPYDLIISNRSFDGAKAGGQELLDELRREHVLPYNTVFMMMTSEAAYHHVVEAAEATLDIFLLAPFNTQTLSLRLAEARRRKREMAAVFAALDIGDLERARVEAHALQAAGGRYAPLAGRLEAELLLRLEQWDEALAAFQALAGPAPPGWVVLGMARARIGADSVRAARQLVQKVIDGDPQNADAHEMMARICCDACEFDQALAAYHRSAELTPGCLLRSQHTGALAFYLSRQDLALQMLQRSVGLGVQSKLFDALSLAMIGLLRHDKRDLPGLHASAAQLARYRERHPQSLRLERMARLTDLLILWVDGAQAAGMRELHALGEARLEPGFDFEAAILLLAAWARAPRGHYEPTERETVMEDLAMRYCTSHAMAQVLLASSLQDPEAQIVIQRCQGRINALCESAVDRSLRHQPLQAVEELLAAGRTTGNTKLLELAQVLAVRHAAASPRMAELESQACSLLDALQGKSTHIAGGRRSLRAPGGLRLRGRSIALPRKPAQRRPDGVAAAGTPAAAA